MDFFVFDRLRRKTYRLRHMYCIFHFNQYNKIRERKEMLHMILFLSRSVVRSLIKNDAIEMEKAEVYQYGFEILFSSIITFLIAVLSGILLHCFAASMLSLLYLQRFGKYAEDITQSIIGVAICYFWG